MPHTCLKRIFNLCFGIQISIFISLLYKALKYSKFLIFGLVLPAFERGIKIFHMFVGLLNPPSNSVNFCLGYQALLLDTQNSQVSFFFF